jgi:hypothetical protein
MQFERPDLPWMEAAGDAIMSSLETRPDQIGKDLPWMEAAGDARSIGRSREAVQLSRRYRACMLPLETHSEKYHAQHTMVL